MTANFVCNDGFSLPGHGKYECSGDGVWIGADSEEINEYPTCESRLLDLFGTTPSFFGLC